MRNRQNTINGTVRSKEAMHYAAHGKTQRIHNNGEHSEYLAYHKENTEEHIENTKHGGPYICSVKCSPHLGPVTSKVPIPIPHITYMMFGAMVFYLGGPSAGKRRSSPPASHEPSSY